MNRRRSGSSHGFIVLAVIVLVVALVGQGCGDGKGGATAAGGGTTATPAATGSASAAEAGGVTLQDAIKARTDVTMLSDDLIELDTSIREPMKKVVAKGQAKEMEGNILLTKDKYAEAVKAYGEAAAFYKQVLDGKKVLERLAQARSKADRARLLAERSADEAKLKDASRLMTNTEGYEEAGEFEAAIAELDKAAGAYEALISKGQPATLEDAVAARTAMLAARKQVRDLPPFESAELKRLAKPLKSSALTEDSETSRQGPKRGSLPDVVTRAVSSEVAAADALEGREYTPARALYDEAARLYKEAASLQTKRDSIVASRKAAEDSLKLADKAFETEARPASFERGKQALADGDKALSDEDLDKAKDLFAQAVASFATAQGEAALANDYAKAQNDYAAAASGVDEALLARHASSEWAAAKDKYAQAEGKAKEADLQTATVVMKDATDAVKAANAKAMTAENAAKAAPVVTRLEDAIARKDKFGAEDTLAEVEKLIPGDPRMAALREKAAALPLPNEFALDLGGGVKMEFVLIRPGSFMMGSDSGDADEKPVRKVTITKPFYLGKYEVTQAQWQAVMGTNPSKFKGEKNPVEQVSWNDCQDFVKKLSEKVGPDSSGFRLPTEAEWEYACRAGSTTKYSFGDSESDLANYAWYSANSGSTTRPVGERRPNAWGLYDMHGNVWEWCQDWRGDYPAGAVDDPQGPSSGSGRVLRGGSWCSGADYCRSTCRIAPSNPYYFIGLRVRRGL